MRRVDAKFKIRLLLAIITIAVLVVAVTCLDKLLERKVSIDEPTPKELEEEMRTITLPSGDYVLNKQIENYLIIGLDSRGTMTSSDSYTNNERADFLVLVSVDSTNNTCNFLQINRDTMAYVPQLSVTGQRYNTAVEQIALAHTYGDGLSTSNFNTVDAVSTMLYGVKIDYYVAMTMDAFVKLTDYIEGVNITFDADYTEINSAYTKGATVKLGGEDALTFVRSRKDLSDSTNIARQHREDLFIDAFIAELKSKVMTTAFVEGATEATADYILTNASVTKLSMILQNLNAYKYGDVVTPEGTVKYDNQFAEFYVDPTDLEEIIIDMFCE